MYKKIENMFDFYIKTSLNFNNTITLSNIYYDK